MTNILTIPPHLPFLDTLAAKILQDHGDNPLVFSNITIFLPNRRACKSLQQAFLRANKGVPLLLPKIQPLGDSDDENHIFKADGGVAFRVMGEKGNWLQVEHETGVTGWLFKDLVWSN